MCTSLTDDDYKTGMFSLNNPLNQCLNPLQVPRNVVTIVSRGGKAFNKWSFLNCETWIFPNGKNERFKQNICSIIETSEKVLFLWNYQKYS